MAIKHPTVKAPGNTLAAVADWNANHTIDINTINDTHIDWGLGANQVSTTDMPEGINLYFTDERVDDRVAALIQNGIGITWTYVDAANTLTANCDLTWAELDKTVSDIADITTKSHTSLTDIGTNTHAQIDTKITEYNAHDHSAADPTQVDHANLTNVTSDQHHTQLHASSHELLGGDLVDHDNLTNYSANRHIDWTASGAGAIHKTNYNDITTIKFGSEGSDSTSTTYVTVPDSDIAFTANLAALITAGFTKWKFVYHLNNSTDTEISYIRVWRQNAATAVAGSEKFFTAVGANDWEILETAWIDLTGETDPESYQIQLKTTAGGTAKYNSALMMMAKQEF